MARGDTRIEYRVRHRRAHWAPTTMSPSRVFQRESALRRYIARLWEKYPDTLVQVSVRTVGSWREPLWWEGWRAGD